MAAVFGDIDNDGDADLYVVMWGTENRCSRTSGGGRFRDITGSSGIGFWGYGNGATFVDYDRDGLLDLFVGNYFPEALPDPATGKPRRLNLWDPFTTKVMHESFTRATNGGRNVLYRNLGGNRFEDVTEAAGLGFTGWTLAVGAADLDNDGWPDLYVANDFGADELYFNTGADETPPRFVPFVGQEGHPAVGDDWWKGMNVDFGDVDGNGSSTSTSRTSSRRATRPTKATCSGSTSPIDGLQHGRKFVNVGKKTGTHDGGWGWGAKFADFNNDGRLDILEANGFVTGPDAGNHVLVRPPGDGHAAEERDRRRRRLAGHGGSRSFGIRAEPPLAAASPRKGRASVRGGRRAGRRDRPAQRTRRGASRCRRRRGSRRLHRQPGEDGDVLPQPPLRRGAARGSPLARSRPRRGPPRACGGPAAAAGRLRRTRSARAPSSAAAGSRRCARFRGASASPRRAIEDCSSGWDRARSPSRSGSIGRAGQTSTIGAERARGMIDRMTRVEERAE